MERRMLRNGLLGMLLALALVAATALLATPALASETASQGRTVQTCGNPLYGGVLQDRESLSPSDELALQADAPTLSQSAAVTYITGKLADRATTFSFTIKDNQEDLTKDLFSKALNEDGVPTHGDSLRWVWDSWTVYRDWWDSPYTTYTFEMTYFTTAEQEELLTMMVDEVLAYLNLEGLSNYEIVEVLYDFISANVVYDYAALDDPDNNLKYTAYAALTEGTAICQGYSTLFYRMAMEAGVSCRVIGGTANGGYHSWNIVQMDDGKYYNLDVTWDSENYHDGWYAFEYFLKCPDEFYDHEREGDASVFGISYTSNSFNKTYPMGLDSYVYGVSDSYIDPNALYAGFPDVRCIVLKAGGADKVWYVSSGVMDYVVENGLIRGYDTNGYFAPGDKITRGQVVTILFRAECAKDPSLLDYYGQVTEKPFKDAAAGAYYFSALAWAKDSGILQGDASTNYTTARPNANITRQELCVILARYGTGGNVPEGELTGDVVAGIADVDAVAGWAEDSVLWAVTNGVMTGSTNSDGSKSLKPTANTTRAEASKMFTVTIRDLAA